MIDCNKFVSVRGEWKNEVFLPLWHVRLLLHKSVDKQIA